MINDKSNVIHLAHTNIVPAKKKCKHRHLAREMNRTHDAIRDISDEKIRNELLQHWRVLVGLALQKSCAEFDMGGSL
jgi:hypothetical protein